MAGRNNAALAAALQAMAQVVGQQQQGAGGGEGVRMLETFLKNHPPNLQGKVRPRWGSVVAEGGRKDLPGYAMQ